jgi:hypothetical protein
MYVLTYVPQIQFKEDSCGGMRICTSFQIMPLVETAHSIQLTICSSELCMLRLDVKLLSVL